MDSLSRTYIPDPEMIKNIRHVGDTVTIKGDEATVTQINLTENSVLDDINVSAVPWMAAPHFTVVLSNGTWAYGEQITRKD